MPSKLRFRDSSNPSVWIEVVEDAPIDGKQYGRKDAAWSEVATKAYVDSVMTPPRWRGIMGNVTVPNNAVTMLSASTSAYNADRVTESGGTFTVAESGIYTINLRGSWATRLTTQRAFVELVRSATSDRTSTYQEGEVSATWTLGLMADDTFVLNAYQASGASNTFQSIRIHVVKVSNL